MLFFSSKICKSLKQILLLQHESAEAHIQQLMHGREDYYRTWSELDRCRSEQRTERTAEQTETPAAMQL